MQDWCFRPACLERFRRIFPDAESHGLDEASHYVVEDACEQIIPLMERFLAAASAGSGSPGEENAEARIEAIMSEVPERSAAVDALTLAQCATLACLLEVSAPKPGNVHRGADFEDLTFLDFVWSAVAIGPAMEDAQRHGVGATVLAAIGATRAVVATNSNLGTALLLAPLAAVPRAQPLAAGVAAVLSALTAGDSQRVYEAIRLAQPGGLGQVEAMDVAASAPRDLRDAMAAASERDLVARQYVTNFAIVLEEVVPGLLAGARHGWSLVDTIVQAQLQLLARYGDSLIAQVWCGGVGGGCGAGRPGTAGGRPR